MRDSPEGSAVADGRQVKIGRLGKIIARQAAMLRKGDFLSARIKFAEKAYACAAGGSLDQWECPTPRLCDGCRALSDLTTRSSTRAQGAAGDRHPGRRTASALRH